MTPDDAPKGPPLDHEPVYRDPSPWPLRIVLAVIALSVAGLLALAVWVVM